MSPLSASVPARVHLAGNPSDGYGGAVLSATVEALVATVGVGPADELSIDGDRDGRALVVAALDELDRWLPATVARRPGRFRWSTTIPRSVGLAGSSAIVVATMLAAQRWWRVSEPLDPVSVARAALAAEVERLGIPGGLADRTVQSIGGTVLTDCRTDPPRVEPVPVARPIPLLLLWDERAAAPSGEYHSALRRRLAQGSPHLMDVMAVLAELASAAAGAVRAGDVAALGQAMDASLDARCELGPVPAAAIAPVAGLRRQGARVNLAGSGGALVVMGDVEVPPGWNVRPIVVGGPVSPAPAPSPSTRSGPSSC